MKLIRWIKKQIERRKEKRTVKKIEKALGIKLYDWQIKFIFGHQDFMNPARACGKTLAHCIRICIEHKKPPLTLNIWKIQDDISVEKYEGAQAEMFMRQEAYKHWLFHELRSTYQKLCTQKIKLRKIIFEVRR